MVRLAASSDASMRLVVSVLKGPMVRGVGGWCGCLSYRLDESYCQNKKQPLPHIYSEKLVLETDRGRQKALVMLPVLHSGNQMQLAKVIFELQLLSQSLLW